MRIFQQPSHAHVKTPALLRAIDNLKPRADVLLGASIVAMLVLGAPALAGGQEKTVRQFILQRYMHGLPYEEARAYGPKAIPELEEMLKDPTLKVHWPKIIGTIAYIGEPRSYRILRDFMWKRFHGAVDDTTWRALFHLQSIMGTIPDSPNSPVIQYLEAGTDPAFWDSLPWTERVHERMGDLQDLLSRMSINGLACTGTERAAEVLSRLRKKPHSPKQLANIDEGLIINQEVREKGLGVYLRNTRARLAKSRDSGGGK